MWGDKKPETQQPTTRNPRKQQAPVAQAGFGKNGGIAMSTDAMRPLSTTPSGFNRAVRRQSACEGRISGSEDLHIDGSVEGLVQLDDRKLTIGPQPS